MLHRGKSMHILSQNSCENLIISYTMSTELLNKKCRLLKIYDLFVPYK